MSHTIKAKSELRDARILERAANRISAVYLGAGTHQLYGSNRATGIGIRLPRWEYPIVINADGEIAFDDWIPADAKFGTRAGIEPEWTGRRAHSEIDAIRQAYAVEAAIDAAQRNGWTVSNETVDAETGAVELTVLR